MYKTLEDFDFKAQPSLMTLVSLLLMDRVGRRPLWLTSFSGAYLFPAIASVSIQLVGSVGGAFWLFTGVCILAFLFGLLMMPETKGRTLEEIARSWKKPST